MLTKNNCSKLLFTENNQKFWKQVENLVAFLVKKVKIDRFFISIFGIIFGISCLSFGSKTET